MLMYCCLQYLAVRYQKLTLSFLTLVVLSVIVGGFACYHFVLALLNQTTNERYKWHHLRKAKEKDERAGGDSANIKPPEAARNVYDRGLWQNFLEEMFPLRHFDDSSEKKDE
jgi:hypothetical protein